MSFVVGLDIGTSAVKAVAMDREGRILGRAQREYRLVTPEPGWVELDPRAVLRAVRDVLRRATEGLAGAPTGIGLSSLGEAFVPVDGRGRVLGDAIVSFDRRATGHYLGCMASPGRDAFEAATGVRPLPHHAVFKWLWWRRDRPDVFGRTRAFVGLASWVAMRLGARPAIDPSLAVRTAVYDPVSGAWADDLVARLGLSVELLPAVLPSEATCGEVSEAGAVGVLRPGTPIVVGGLDQACAAFALGVDAAHGMLTLGTTAVVCIARTGRDGIPIEIPPVPMVDGRGWLAMAGSPAGGTALRWLRDRVLRAKGPGGRDEGRLVDDVAEHRTDALFLPHLGGSRVAFDDPGATAAFTGLTHASDRTDLVRAVLDGVAYEVAMLLRRLSGAGLQVPTLRANGGGSRSRSWMQLIADATGLPVESVAGTDSAARGAARLALADTSGAVEDVAFRVDPRPRWRGYHDERLSRYVRTYEALRAIREQEDERA